MHLDFSALRDRQSTEGGLKGTDRKCCGCIPSLNSRRLNSRRPMGRWGEIFPLLSCSPRHLHVVNPPSNCSKETHAAVDCAIREAINQ